MGLILMVCTCIFSIVVADKKAELVCQTDGYQLIEAKFGKETYTLCLQLKPIGSSPLTNRNSALFLEPDSEESPSGFKGFPLSEVTMAYGFPVADPGKGSAEGYIGEDHQFYGVLHFGNRTLHADPYGHDDPTKYFGAFENDNMAAPRSRRDHAQHARSVFTRSVGYFPFSIENRSRVPGVARARICDLLLLADKEFFEKDANSSLNHVVRRMMHAIAQADIIFRNADFNEDGVPDNIGFSVKYILVLTSTETNMRVFGDLLSTRAINGRNYLMRFARLRRLSEVCLGVAFSGHAFQNRTLGLSFTSLGGGMGGAAGGLCDRRAYGRSFNTLAIAHATTEDKARVPERIAALTLAHEMGHSFGAHHDDNFPNPECRGHLMGSQSSTAENGMNFEFSLCSKRLIAATLSSMSYCLLEEDIPYCGNGIVEEGEACDCGLPSRCVHKDPCCTPRGGGALIYKEGTLHKEGCSVAPLAMCHPSQGLCCTPKCQLADLTKSGIDCRMQEQECNCARVDSDCRCGLGGRCLPDGTCHAAECARLGLRECQCVKGVEPDILTEMGMCGICCQVNSSDNTTEPRCIAAQAAALETIAAAKIAFPSDWPDPDYNGPNVSINICANPEGCNITYLRAWSPGSLCVTRNMVGVCSPNGLCKMDYIVPRSNVYPDIMMPRKRTRTTTKASWTVDSLENAVSVLKRGSISVYKVSQQTGIPYSTLKKRYNLAKSDDSSYKNSPKLGRPTVFNVAQEEILANHLRTMSNKFYGLTREQFRKVCYSVAKQLGIEKRFNQDNQTAGKDWLAGFLQRHPDLSIRKPEAISINRILGFNKTEITLFFNNLEKLMEHHRFEPQMIYNVDETGITTVQETEKIIAPKGQKRVGSVTSWERGKTVTVICAMSAAGSFVPPLFIFPRQRHSPQLEKDGPVGAVYTCSHNGWTNEKIFVLWLRHFIKHTKPDAETPVLLILDNHNSHATLEAWELAKENHVIMLTIPPHSSHRLQPLDVAFYSPLKRAYNKECNLYIKSRNLIKITPYDVAGLFNKAYTRVASIEKGVSSFKATGIFPMDPGVFCDDDFINEESRSVVPVADAQQQPTNVTPIPSTSNQAEQPNASPATSLSIFCDLQIEPEIIERETAVTPVSIPSTSSHTIRPIATPPNIDFANVVSIVSPLPQQLISQKQKPLKNKQHSEIITRTPMKAIFEEKKRKRTEKENKTKTIKKNKGNCDKENCVKGKCAKGKCIKKKHTKDKEIKSRRTTTRNTRIRKATKCLFESDDENSSLDQIDENAICDDESKYSEEDNLCAICLDPGKSEEMWYRCRSCGNWSHKECSGSDSPDTYICAFCLDP